MSSNLINRILLVLAFAGIFVSGYLTMAHWIGAKVACGTAVDGCGKVAASGYAFLPFGGGHEGKFGIPVAAFGLFAYVVLAVLAVARSMNGESSSRLASVGTLVSGLGTLISLGFMYLSFFVIQGTCTWCVASAIIMTLTFILHLLLKGAASPSPHFSAPVLGAVSLLTFGGLFFAASKMDPPVKQVDMTPEQLTPQNPNTYGDPNAKIVMVEFMDLTCDHCKAAYSELKRMMIEDGAKLQVVMRHFPLRQMEGHEMALPAAVIGEMVAEKGKFPSYVEMVFNTPHPDLTVDKLLQYAASLGVDRASAEKRMVDPKDPAFLRMQRDIAMADELGILSTPTFYIGERGKKVFAAKNMEVLDVLKRPDIQPLWDPKLGNVGK